MKEFSSKSLLMYCGTTMSPHEELKTNTDTPEMSLSDKGNTNRE